VPESIKFDKIKREVFTGKKRSKGVLKRISEFGIRLREEGQAIVDYMLLIALIIGLISLVISMFEPRSIQMMRALKSNVKNIVSNGSADTRHPLEEGRIKEL